MARVREYSKSRRTLLGELHKELGRGDEAHISQGGKGQVMQKAKVLSITELEDFVLPTRGRKKQIERLASLGVSCTYGEFKDYIIEKVCLIFA